MVSKLSVYDKVISLKVSLTHYIFTATNGYSVICNVTEKWVQLQQLNVAHC